MTIHGSQHSDDREKHTRFPSEFPCDEAYAPSDISEHRKRCLCDTFRNTQRSLRHSCQGETPWTPGRSLRSLFYYRLNKNLRLERIIFIVSAVIIAAIAAFTFYKGIAVSERSEELSRWYEENNEAILFGRYLRVNENNRWRFWHDKWVNDPGLKEDMSDYFLMEELKEKRKK